MRLPAPTHAPDIICIGTNYRAADVSSPRQELTDDSLEVFLKPSAALIGDGTPIPMPRFDDLDLRLDCEGELAVVIGKQAHGLDERRAFDHVLGFTIANDLTARRFQTATGPPLWMRGKGFPGFCPLGPHIVTLDELGDPDDLVIRTLVNGRVVREGSTRRMIRNTRQGIAALSRHMILREGAVILTGAPPVIDETMKSHSLKTGDVLTVEIDGIGRLTNAIR